jgi:hypothetical protein
MKWRWLHRKCRLETTTFALNGKMIYCYDHRRWLLAATTVSYEGDPQGEYCGSPPCYTESKTNNQEGQP